MERLVTQLQWRNLEGEGTCLYELGVKDDGSIIGLTEDEYNKSIECIEYMAKELNYEYKLNKVFNLNDGLFLAEILIFNSNFNFDNHHQDFWRS